ncbi:MAG TPA: TrmH family RNA methyltransferase, partial [Pirellulaceae bacterium]|nr:TrmH family RNA methyltransferase [Pirellulaceae bacterium]
MPKFEHLRHKPPTELAQPRELVVVCAPFKSNVNLSNILRTASCCGVRKVYASGNAKVDKTIARDGADEIELSVHRTLPPVLKELKLDGYQLVGLEQTTNSTLLCEHVFARRTALVIGNERQGLTDDVLALLDAV